MMPCSMHSLSSLVDSGLRGRVSKHVRDTPITCDLGDVRHALRFTHALGIRTSLAASRMALGLGISYAAVQCLGRDP